MTSKSSNLATLKTIGFVQVVPWFVITFASSIAVMLIFIPQFMKSAIATNASTTTVTTTTTTTTVTTTAATTTMMIWYPLITAGVAMALSLVKDIGFIVWARKKLYFSFREQAVRSTAGPVRFAVPPPLPRPIAPPPVGPALLNQ